MRTTLEKYNIFFAVSLLLLFGIGITFLASYNISIKHQGQPYYYIKRHIQYVFLGLISFVIFLKFPIRYLFHWRLIIPAFLLGIALLVLVFVPPFNKSIGTANRWLNLGFVQFQPSEIFKVIYLLTLTFIIDIKKEKKDLFIEGMLLPFIVIFLTFILIVLEPDFSTGLIMLLTGFTLLYIYKIKKTFFLIVLSFFFMMLVPLINNKKYLLDRFYFLKENKEEYVFNQSYQLRQSLLSFEGNNFWGNSYKNVLQSIKNFPDAHTDFSFSIVIYAYGLLGALFVLLTFYYFLKQTVKLVLKLNDFKEKFLTSGILILISYEFVFHILVTLGLFPTTGVFLPFIGYGGTAIITHMAMIGLITQMKLKSYDGKTL